ncbi:hypothetical protein CAI21_06030 [Alkalilimnicola ehrlichii]|uniref:Protein kinase domain-containing protein n=1 Tax=Alkalilimnicola ehrlichii TaxID=351052 RepID=A0A3E0X136_9GAMM|nr:hypothetical protein [Alkalilimnicola ehrlichii]RFA30591.1 hypothetical protein CAI21_06030 [Alkalilimnicola ehrlichii]RFA38141.1 hypothetical protein CAL65_07395 [Alkalilimnicola ehrlichii]
MAISLQIGQGNIFLTGYQSAGAMYEGNTARVYRARRESDGQPVILKVLRGGADAQARLRKEYELVRSLTGRGSLCAC